MSRTNRLLHTAAVAALAATVGGCSRAAFAPQMPEAKTDVVSESLSKLEITDENVADGISPAQVKLLLISRSGKPMKAYVAKLTVTGSENVIVPCPPTNDEGRAHCLIYSTRSEMKHVHAVGHTSLTASAMFLAPKPLRSSVAIVAAGDINVLPSGHKVIATGGTIESDAALRDSTQALRVHSSVLGSIISD